MSSFEPTSEVSSEARDPYSNEAFETWIEAGLTVLTTSKVPTDSARDDRDLSLRSRLQKKLRSGFQK
jgi:hypothetical protein